MATATLKVLHTIFGSKIVSWRFVKAASIMSVLLTTLALTHFFQKHLVFDDLNTPSHLVWLYGVNWIFDVATFLITWKAISIIKEAPIWVVAPIIAFDIYSAIVLAGFCYIAAVVFGNFFAKVQVTVVLLPFHWPFNPSAVLHSIYDSLIQGSEIVLINGGLAYDLKKGAWITGPLVTGIGVTRTDGLFMITMLLPTFIYMSILASIMIGKATLGGARVCTLYLESRASYSEQIKAALEKARVVVVIWTAGAMISDYVYAEAVSAQAQGKLVNVQPADMSFRDIPEPFNIHHIDEAEDHARILATIAKVMAGTPIPTRVPLHEIYYRQHGQRLIDPKQRKLARDPREIGPTELLQAKFEVVSYIDATGIRAQLIDWCAGNARPTAGRLIYGPGGLGKTRLMIKVAATLRQQGWMAGFLDRPHEQLDATLKQRWQALDQLIAHGEDEGLIIVLDYAEGRQDEVRQIAERLSARPESDTRPIRLVLLARSAGEWWTTLHDDTPEVQRVFRGTGSSPDVAALPSISRGQQRLDLFDASLKAFAPLLSAQGHVLPADEPSQERCRRIESGVGYSRPLAIQMEALLWLASAAPDAGATVVDVLLRRVLGLERNHWKKLVGALDEECTRDMARGVAQVTAVQGVPSAVSTERLLMADDFYQGQRTARAAVDPVVHHLCRAYGKPDGGVGPLEPDLIGEHHVATVGDIELIDGCLRWIEAEPADMRGKRRHDLLAVLQRATQPEHGTEANNRALTLLDHLVSTQARTLAAEVVAVMVDTPGALADRLDQHADMLDEKSLGAIAAALLRVNMRRAHLARLRLAAAEVEGADQHESRLNHLAACMETVGLRLSNFGRHEEALAASEGAVDIRRHLAQTRPDAFLPDLARSISVMSKVLAALERHVEAAQAAHQALEILAPFVERYPEAYGQLARTIGAGVLRYIEAAEQPPNMALLERVARALGSDGSG